MLTVRRLDIFKRDYKQARRKGKDLADLDALIVMLTREIPLPPEYRDHALHGEWAGHRECHIEGDWLLIYKVEGATLTLVRTGTHRELFRSWRGR